MFKFKFTESQKKKEKKEKKELIKIIDTNVV